MSVGHGQGPSSRANLADRSAVFSAEDPKMLLTCCGTLEKTHTKVV